MSMSNKGRAFIKLTGCMVLMLAIAAQARQATDARQVSEPVTAIVGATVIDGNGGPPMPDATVIVRGKRIAAVGPRASISVPSGATVIDAAGKYVTPGFMDTNVHVSLYGNVEALARYQPRIVDIAIEGAQLNLKYGITTIRDSYGQLLALTKARDMIARGEVIGPRLLVAGNIVGWGGPFSVSFSTTRDSGLTPFQEQMNDLITQGSGEELTDMTPEELRVAINKYLDKGQDFIKYGGTTHNEVPAFIVFSPDAQKVIVEETHKRGLVAETHATTPEGLRISILAGIDLIQHPEAMPPNGVPDALVQLICERRIICSILANTISGPAWRRYLKTKEEAQKKQAEADKEAGASAKRAKTLAERRQEYRDLGVHYEIKRLSVQKMIRAGCIITPSTDSTAPASEFARTPKSIWMEPGIGTLIAIEGLVEIGMTPAQAIVAATKNGALACRMQKDLGTIEAGKIADILVLDADPLADIANIRKLRVVMKEGRVIDTSKLPENPVFYRALPQPPTD